MKTFNILCTSALVLILMITGCGLVSGTKFISQHLDDSIVSSEGMPAAMHRGNGPLDDNVGSAKVDLTDNSDYGNIDVNGIEAGCVSTLATNCNPHAPISGEVWVTQDTVAHTDWTADSVRANCFRVFHGMFLDSGATHQFTCEETLGLIENLDQFSDVVNVGYFRAWGIGDQDVYCIRLENIYVGMYLTGSLQ
jgi:hypothetical protein